MPIYHRSSFLRLPHQKINVIEVTGKLPPQLWLLGSRVDSGSLSSDEKRARMVSGLH